MKNNFILSLGSSPLFLLRRNITEGGEDIQEEELKKKENRGEGRSMRMGKRREERPGGERKNQGRGIWMPSRRKKRKRGEK